MKLGDKKIWHFAHKSNQSCFVEMERETKYHLQGKKLLYQWFKHQNIQVALEVYLPFIRQRPDLLVKVNQKVYAIEFQCSSLSLASIRKRNAGYRQIGITPIWILGGHQLRRKNATTFNIQAPFWEMMLPQEENKRLKLLYYCPENQKFSFLNHIQPISATQAHAHLQEVGELYSTYYTLITENQIPSNAYTNWNRLRKKWRTQPPPEFPAKKDYTLLQILYRNHLSLSTFPLEAGWPTAYYFQIESSPLIWQTSLLLECLMHQPKRKPIHFQVLSTWLLSFLHTNKIACRYDSDTLTEKALEFYLNWLCELNVLRRAENSVNIFLRLRNYTQIESVEQALKSDEEMTESFINYERKNSKKVLF
ncbi:hypothetical protein AB990_20190 [Alkalihalobacillus pseudalcaliphilus]|nr:hypothetical protein AB990_20190 [Alkalihalobacillus pseudalcaliphilus]